MREVTPNDALDLYLDDRRKTAAQSTIDSHEDRLSWFVKWFARNAAMCSPERTTLEEISPVTVTGSPPRLPISAWRAVLSSSAVVGPKMVTIAPGSTFTPHSSSNATCSSTRGRGIGLSCIFQRVGLYLGVVASAAAECRTEHVSAILSHLLRLYFG